MSETLRITPIDQHHVVAYVPLGAFKRAGVQPDGVYAIAIGESVRVEGSPGAAASISWLAAHAADNLIAPYIPMHEGEPDQGALWALSSRVASKALHHPTDRRRPYPECVWSD